jgi:uncharacterized protein YndB with AHSA1/START domain
MTATDPYRLTVTVQGDRGILIARRFPGAPALVFQAFTSPAILQRWFGPPGWSLPVCEIDLRPGGAYRYLMRHDDGATMGFGGVYREVASPGRLVHTERFDQPWYPGEAVITTAIAGQDGAADFAAVVEYESPAARDGVLATGMAGGVAASYDRLAALLPALSARSA